MGNEPIMIDMKMLLELSKGIYTIDDFKQMETDILFGLNWRVNGPTAQSFVVHFLSLIMEQQEHPQQHQQYEEYQQQRQDQEEKCNPTEPMNSPYSSFYKRLFELSTYQIELSVGEYELMTHKPSTVAMAAIWNCLEDHRHGFSHNNCTSTNSCVQIERFRRHFLDILSTMTDIQMKHFLDIKRHLHHLLKDDTKMVMRTTSNSSSSHPFLHGGRYNQREQHSSPTTSTATATTTTAATTSRKARRSPNCVSKRNLYNHTDG